MVEKDRKLKEMICIKKIKNILKIFFIILIVIIMSTLYAISIVAFVMGQIIITLFVSVVATLLLIVIRPKK